MKIVALLALVSRVGKIKSSVTAESAHHADFIVFILINARVKLHISLSSLWLIDLLFVICFVIEEA